jgi:hypothetical protein
MSGNELAIYKKTLAIHITSERAQFQLQGTISVLQFYGLLHKP